MREGFVNRKRQAFDIVELQKLADKHNFTRRNRLVEDRRCANDLLYALFQRPHTVLDRLLPGMLEIATRKNAPDIERERLFCDARSFLLTAPHANEHVRVFAVLLVLNREPEAQTVFKAGYTDGNVWGDAEAGRKRFERFLPHLAQLVEGVFQAPFGETNVVQLMFEMVVGAKIFYLSK